MKTDELRFYIIVAARLLQCYMLHPNNKFVGKPMIEITKYANRRLYAQGRYVRLSEVQEWIKEGESIRVVHQHTGADMTHEVLLDILKQSETVYPRMSDQQLRNLICAP